MKDAESKKINERLGNIFRQTRNEHGWSLDELRSHMKNPKAKSTLKRYEDGGTDMAASVMEDISDALHLNMNYVWFYLDDNENNPYDKYLPGSMTNAEYRNLINKTKDELPKSFIQEYAKMNDFHKNMIWQLIQTYAREDTEKEGDDHGSHKE
jgi:transcriptional regulator with XRE-family HTH domain